VQLNTVLATSRSGLASAGNFPRPARNERGEGRKQDLWKKDPAKNLCRFKIASSPRPSPPLFVEEREKIIALGSFGQGRCQAAPGSKDADDLVPMDTNFRSTSPPNSIPAKKLPCAARAGNAGLKTDDSDYAAGAD
jgi:hypothetical protein